MNIQRVDNNKKQISMKKKIVKLLKHSTRKQYNIYAIGVILSSSDVEKVEILRGKHWSCLQCELPYALRGGGGVALFVCLFEKDVDVVHLIRRRKGELAEPLAEPMNMQCAPFSLSPLPETLSRRPKKQKVS